MTARLLLAYRCFQLLKFNFLGGKTQQSRDLVNEQLSTPSSSYEILLVDEHHS